MEDLDAYLRSFREVFGRKDRFHWAKGYLSGLMASGERKTIEGIARSIDQREHRVADIWQALQNFIQDSPWDEGPVMRVFRQKHADLSGPIGMLVVDDMVLLKQGRHSVGVQRQYSTEHGRKVNCQLVPTIFAVAQKQAAPIAFRLYLPRAWQEDPLRLAKCKVPTRTGEVESKACVALRLLGELQHEQFPCVRIAAGEAYVRSDEFRNGVAAMGMQLAPNNAGAACDESTEAHLHWVRKVTSRLKARLGMDHFEGRTWRGLHHHLCLVVLAHGFEYYRTRSRRLRVNATRISGQVMAESR